MSDTAKTILWIVVALVVIAVIIWLFTAARRNKEADARRFEASELRAQVEDRLPQVQSYEDRASVTGQMAAEARAEADEKAAAATMLEHQAEEHRATAESARAEHDELARRADLVDPDVPTDSEGYLVDDSGHRFEGQGDDEAPGHEEGRPETAESGTGATTLGAAAGAVAGGALGAAYAHDDDDEEDLADAENPFAATTSDETEARPGPEAAVAPTAEPGAGVAHEPESASESAREPDAGVESEPERERVGVTEPEVDSEPQAAESERQAESDVDSEPERDGEARVESDTEFEAAREPEAAAESQRDAGAESRPEPEAAREPEAAAESPQEPDDEPRDLETTSPEAAVTDAVPALQDRDTHVAQGGTPQDDPGDHRGQPWATSPGVPGLEEDSAEPEVQEPQPTLDTGQGVEGFDDEDETPRRPADQAGVEDSWGHDGEAAQPTGAEAVSTSQPTDEASEESPQPTEDASDESREPTGDASDAPPEPTGDASDAPPEPTGQNDESASQPSAEAGAETRQERRISSFEEVADGGFGIGSAAPIADGAQPLGHAVKGTHEGKSFLAPGEAGYDDVEPDVWFFNEEAARRAGFDRKAD